MIYVENITEIYRQKLIRRNNLKTDDWKLVQYICFPYWTKIGPHPIYAIAGEAHGYRISIFLGRFTWASCTCKGWHFSQKCKHIRKILEENKNPQ